MTTSPFKVRVTKEDLDDFVHWILEPLGGEEYYHVDIITNEFNARAQQNGKPLVDDHDPTSLLSPSTIQGWLLFHALNTNFWEIIAGNRRT